MFLVSAAFQFTAPLSEEEIGQIETDVIRGIFARSPGFQSYYAVRSAENETLAMSIWDDEASYQTALSAATSKLQSLIQSKVAGPPQRKMGTVRLHIGK